ELLAARGLDHLAGPIDVDAVVPAVAGIEGQWRGERLVLAAGDAGHAHRLLVFDDVGVPDLVREAGGVGEQVAQCDVALRLAHLRLARGIEAVEYLDLTE